PAGRAVQERNSSALALQDCQRGEEVVDQDLQNVPGLRNNDFPGADMARKFLPMGWTRVRRYANHKGGRKYDKATGRELPRVEDPEKAAAAGIFYEKYIAARGHPEYIRLKRNTGRSLRNLIKLSESH